MTDMPAAHLFQRAIAAAAIADGAGPDAPPGGHGDVPIGVISAIAGASSRVLLDRAAIAPLLAHPDAVLAAAGQVGSQVKIRVGTSWIIANVRSLALEAAMGSVIAGEIDFLGEGDEDRATGALYGFRRGVTRYPMPGCEVFAVTTRDLREVYAAEDRANIAIGTVYPTTDVPAALYVDAMLGKHFALVGSTGTGKSTAAALILHRICDLAPQGHIVMIDPHGEYAAAFGTNGAIHDVSNLQMPYWLMNFEEHCEVFLTSTGEQRQFDADILAKCLLAARAKSRLGQAIAKLTVDAPIPYLLSDLTASSASKWVRWTAPATPAPICGSRARSTRSRPIRAMASCSRGCSSRTRWRRFSSASSACPATAGRSRSSMCRACRRTSPPSSSRCSHG
ncbi:hypothetical protein FHY04_001537 [Sphingomonas sp. BK481]|nr:hypothetical protein [Sphingomonas sp. BK481]